MARPASIRFDDVVIDVAAREVVRDGDRAHLEPQAFDLLLFLVHERDRVVSKEELLDEVWGDQFVSESALTTRIKEIRRAVGDDGTRQRVVKNIRGHGYRFVADVVERGGNRPASIRRRLVGRDELLARSLQLLDRVPLLTLVGPGGVGKTALADAVVAARPTPDGAIIVPLAAIETPDAVLAAVRSAGSLTDPTTDDDVASTLAALDGLLVLDNCEHLLERVAALVERIIRTDGSLRVVATSRERLGVDGEQVLPVSTLTPIAARELFVERAASAQPDFRVPDDEVLDDIVRLLDNLPLAIEMAAARVSSIGLRDLRDLIAAEQGILDSPNRAVTERHRTLDDLVSWSERLLDDDGRTTLRSFSVFAGPVGSDDVAGVLGDDERPRAMASVAKLVDRSLVVVDTDRERPTYRMLATIRGYAARGRPGDADRRHAEWFTNVAEEADRTLRTTDEAAGDARIGAITDELRAAHRWAREEDPQLAARLTAALDRYAHCRHWPEPADWAAALEPRLREDELGSDEVRAALAAEAAHRGDYERAIELATRAADAASPQTRASALETLGDVAIYSGDLTAAAALSRRLVEIARETGDLHALVLGLSDLALAIAYGGDPAGGLRSLEPLRELDLPPSGRAWLAYTTAECRSATDPAHALTSYEEAIELGRSVNNRFVAGVATVGRLALQARVGEPDEALAAFVPVLRDYRRSGDATHSITALRNLIDLLVRIDDDETAIHLLGALSSRTLKATYGEESERLAAARQVVEDRHGAEMVSGWALATAGRGYQWALDEAIRHIAERTRA